MGREGAFLSQGRWEAHMGVRGEGVDVREC